MKDQIRTRNAILCCIYSGLAFGIYWYPVRKLRDAGLNDIWSIFVFSLIPFLLVLPLIYKHRRKLTGRSLQFHTCCLLAGAGFALYSGAYLYTTVVHAIVLYYLLPIWGFIFGRIFAKESITLMRWIAIVFAMIGIQVLISKGSGIPIPTNLGDWMALTGGLMWGLVAVMLYTGDFDPLDATLGFISWSVVASLAIAFVSTVIGVVPYPHWGDIAGELVWLIPFAILVIVPAAFCTMYGPTALNPGVAGLLFMAEISVGTVTSALFSGERLGIREVVGVTAITAAGLVEPIYLLFKMRKSHELQHVK